MFKKDLQIQFDPKLNGIIANTIGELTESDIEAWSQNLINILEEQLPLQTFKLLINGNGYYPKSIKVHKKLNQFLHTNEIVCKQCCAVAFIHHDPNHVREVQPLSSDTQGFFTVYEDAYYWLKTK